MNEAHRQEIEAAIEARLGKKPLPTDRPFRWRVQGLRVLHWFGFHKRARIMHMLDNGRLIDNGWGCLFCKRPM